MLLKINDLKDYIGRKLTKEEIIEEAKMNEAEGLRKNKFKYGIYNKYWFIIINYGLSY